MKDRLIVADARSGCYAIAWHLADEGDTGAAIGEYEPLDDDPRGTPDERLFRLAERVVARLAAEDLDGIRRFRGVWEFESEAKAQKALRQINAEWKVLKAGTPWPDWAHTALAAGWRAPKGWTP